ncbi:hypothetical protein [Minwuia sp. IMCC3077]|uniref:hypothetical protein n=1 Tax=Minwuia sp. IMCC3077 TaxID=3040676 RepID=UPI002478E56C|nr:hypothetical protein [Minwuia sp. IMCC3077]
MDSVPERKGSNRARPHEISANAKPGESETNAVARSALRPTIRAGVSILEYSKAYGDIELGALIEALSDQTEKVTSGDLGRGEAMLAAQAHTLDAIFNELARRAINAEYMDNLDRYLRLALKAQAQCRMTWEAVSSIKNPPMMGYVRQANIAHGHQQVNNGSERSSGSHRVRENPDMKNRLLEEDDEQRLDTGTPQAAGTADPELVPVGKVDGSENG